MGDASAPATAQAADPIDLARPAHRRAEARAIGCSRAAEAARTAFDRFLGSDPGLNRLRVAVLAVAGIGLTLVAEFVFVRATGALQVPTHALPGRQAAAAGAANHASLVLAMLFGGIVALLGSFAQDSSARRIAVTALATPVPIVASFIAEIAVHGHRSAGLALIPVALTAGTYLRRFGPRGFLLGQVLFMGSFLGFLVGGSIRLGQTGWVAAELSLGALMGLVAHLAFAAPRAAADLRRSRRSWQARARRVLDLAVEVVDAGDGPGADRLARRLRRQLVRLNESSLIIDAQLGTASAPDGSAGAVLHQRLFDVELALGNVARFAEALARRPLPAGQHAEIRRTLRALRGADDAGASAGAHALLGLIPSPPERGAFEARFDPAVTDRVVAHRFARSALYLVESYRALHDLAEGIDAGTVDAPGFEPATTLVNGWLPGSTQVSAQASTTPRQGPGSRRLVDRITLPPYARTSLQAGVAVSVALVAGDALDARRFYWAVLAVYVTFLATNTTGEQLRKASNRLVGTAIGIVLGILLVHVTEGHTTWSIAVVLVALFVAIYLIRISYLFMVLGITVMVSQLYVQLAEYSHALLYLRLEETAVGFGAVSLTILLVAPLHADRVLETAETNALEAVGEAVAAAVALLADGADRTGAARLRDAVRAVDAREQEILAVAEPLRHPGLERRADRLRAQLAVFAGLRNYVRNLAEDLDGWSGLTPDSREAAHAAAAELHEGLQVLTARISRDEPGTYRRTASRFDRLPTGAPRSGGTLTTRDLALVDGSLARLAESLELPVADHDTGSATQPDWPARPDRSAAGDRSGGGAAAVSPAGPAGPGGSGGPAAGAPRH